MSIYLVTGLCMQGNKGGPAIALSLVEQIKSFIPEAEFIFSVPGSEKEWAHELKAAQEYGFKVIKGISLKDCLPPFGLKSESRVKLSSWWSALKSASAVIEMSAISYVGPPSRPGTLRSVISSPRFIYFVLARLASRNMFAWTQSYGPLTTITIRFFARLDLRRQPIVFCRGSECCDAVQKLLPKSKALSFPDVAVSLAFDKQLGLSLLEESIFAGGRAFVTLSPSAVMYARSNKCVPNTHVRDCILICKKLVNLGYGVLLIPHTVRPSDPDPLRCDREVAREVFKLASDANVQLLESNLSPIELKSIIANAEFHIGARYHSLVAALSSGVPSIAISWHPKYSDLMREYGQEHYILEENKGQTLSALVDALHMNLKVEQECIRVMQEQLAADVNDNAKLFCEILKGNRY